MSKAKPKPFMIAVHGGAGTQRVHLEHLCAKIIRQSNGDIVDAIKMMEDDPLTNAGFGSNLTIDGQVECEAAYACSNRNIFGAIGAVSRIRNPIVAAYELAKEQLPSSSDDQLLSPLVLVGQGAEQWAISKGLEACEANELISEQAVKDWTMAKDLLAKQKAKIASENGNDGNGAQNNGSSSSSSSSSRMDTVGAVSVTANGECSAACSSGGVLLKRNGRLGHSVQLGGAIWAQQYGSRSVAISLSGCGEYIAKTCLAQKIAQTLLQQDPEEDVAIELVKNVFDKEFIHAPLLAHRSPKRILAGGLVLIYDSNLMSAELIVFHNTRHLPFAFNDGQKQRKCFSERSAQSPFIIHSFPAYLNGTNSD